MTEQVLNAPATYDGKPVGSLSDARLALALADVKGVLARLSVASPMVKKDKAAYLARMAALLPVIEAEIAGRGGGV